MKILLWDSPISLLWNPIDDLKGLYDPNATERGLQRPRDVASKPLLTKLSYPLHYCIDTVSIRVLGYSIGKLIVVSIR